MNLTDEVAIVCAAFIEEGIEEVYLNDTRPPLFCCAWVQGFLVMIQILYTYRPFFAELNAVHRRSRINVVHLEPTHLHLRKCSFSKAAPVVASTAMELEVLKPIIDKSIKRQLFYCNKCMFLRTLAKEQWMSCRLQ